MTRALAAALVVACTLPLVAESAASGQALEGVISGRVRLGTEGAAPIESLPVQLIVLGGGPPRTLETETQGDAFRFAVDADPLVSYVVRVVYRGVQYIAPPVLLSRELPTAEVELTVFETTRERPPLEIESTLLTVIALDRTNAQLTLLREDRVNNPGDRVYVGGEAGVTLRLPVPDGMVAADGSGEGSYRLEGGTLVATEPLRPGTTTVVTRYVVSYDRGRRRLHAAGHRTAPHAADGDRSAHPLRRRPRSARRRRPGRRARRGGRTGRRDRPRWPGRPRREHQRAPRRPDRTKQPEPAHRHRRRRDRRAAGARGRERRRRLAHARSWRSGSAP